MLTQLLRFQRSLTLWLTIAALVTGATVSAPRLPAGESAGWQALLANDWQKAAELLCAETATDSPERLENLEGLALLQSVLGKDGESRATREKMARLTRQKPEGVFFFERYWHSDSPYYPGNKLQTAEELFSQAAPALRARIGERLAKMYSEAANYEKARHYAEATGAVTLFARLSGEYNMEGPQDTDQPLPPQTAPAKTGYRDALGQIIPVMNDIHADPQGKLVPADYLAPSARTGEIIVQAALESPTEQNVLLEISDSPTSMQVWLNTWPVYKAHYFHAPHPRQRILLQVNLRQGVNTVILRGELKQKLMLRVLDPQGAPLSTVKALPFSANDWREAAYHDLRGALLANVVGPHLFGKPRNAATTLWRVFYLLQPEWQVFAEAEDLMDNLVKQHPQSALLHVLSALVKNVIAERSDGRYNAGRLRQQADELAARALELAPDCLPASMLKASLLMNNELQEQALNVLSPLQTRYPECAELHHFLAEAYLDKNYDRQAALAIDTFARLQPDAYWRLMNFRKRQGRLEESQKLFSQGLSQGMLFDYSRTFRHLLANHDYASARRLMDDWTNAHPQAHLAQLKLLRAWENASGKHNPQTLSELIKLHARMPQYLLRAAEDALRAGDTASAAALFTKGHQVAMRQHTTPHELLQRQANTQPTRDLLRKYDISLKDIAASAREVRRSGKASFATLLRVEATRLYPDLSAESFRHCALKPFDRSGVDELGEIEFPPHAEMLYCHTLQPDGTVFIPEGADNRHDKAVSMYNVKPDSVLEYACHSATGSRSEMTTEFDFSGLSADVVRSRYCLIMPVELLRRARIKTTPKDFTPRINELPNDLVALVWDAANEEGILPEKFLPREEPPIRRVRIRVFAPENRRAEIFVPQPPLHSSPRIIDTAREICVQARTSLEKLQAVQQWIAKEIADGEELESARDIMAMRSANTQGRALLCQAMLAAVGVKSYFSQANPAFSQQNGQTVSARRAALRNGFGKKMLVVEIPEEHRKEWLVFHKNQKFFRLHDIGAKMDGVLALTESPWGLRLESVRSDRAELIDYYPPVFKLANDGSAEISSRMTLYGSLAGTLRAALEIPHRAAQLMQRRIATLHPHIVDLSLQYPRGDELTKGSSLTSEPVTVGYQGKIRKYALAAANGAWSVRSVRQSGVAKLIVPLPRRHNIELPNDIVASETVEYHAPEGWAFSTVPPDRSLTGEFGSYLQDYHVEGRRLTVTRSLIIPAQTIPAAQAEDYNRFLSLVKENDEASFLIVPLPEKSLFTSINDWGECGLFDAGNLFPRELPENVQKFLQQSRPAEEKKVADEKAL